MEAIGFHQASIGEVRIGCQEGLLRQVRECCELITVSDAPAHPLSIFSKGTVDPKSPRSGRVGGLEIGLRPIRQRADDIFRYDCSATSRGNRKNVISYVVVNCDDVVCYECILEELLRPMRIRIVAQMHEILIPRTSYWTLTAA